MGRGEEDGTTPQALLLQAQVAAAECNAAEARGAILDLALHPQTTQEMLASGVTSFLAFLFSKPNLISEELLEGGIKPVIQMLPDKPRQMAERPEGYPGEGGRLTGAVAATAAADICDCILHQAGQPTMLYSDTTFPTILILS